MEINNFLDATRFNANLISEELLDYQLTWENFLLLMERPGARHAQTLLLTVRGNLLVVKRPLRGLLREFFASQCLDDDHNWAYYQFFALNGRSRSAVAGRYRLVPTCAPRSHQVCWVMAHQLTSFHAHCRGSLLIFRRQHATHSRLQVLIDSSYQKLKNNLAAADMVGAFQLAMIEYDQYLAGCSTTTLQPIDYARLLQLHQQRERYDFIYQRRRFNRYYRHVYGEDLSTALEQELKRTFTSFSPY